MKLEILLAAALLAAHAATLGINCRGSLNCGDSWPYTPANKAQALVGYINGINANRWYANGEQIACFANHCAFLQRTGGAWGSKIRQLAPYITGHGCSSCGSVPYYYPQGNNNVADGMLTFNYVNTAKCSNRLC